MIDVGNEIEVGKYSFEGVLVDLGGPRNKWEAPDLLSKLPGPASGYNTRPLWING